MEFFRVPPADLKGIISMECNYVPELRAVRWKGQGGGRIDGDTSIDSLNEILLTAREYAAAQTSSSASSGCWISAKCAANAPQPVQNDFYNRPKETPVSVRVAVEAERVVDMLYAAMVLSHKDCAARASGRTSCRKLWDGILRVAVPRLIPWPYSPADDAKMQARDTAEMELRSAEQGLAKAVGKAARAAARLEALGKTENIDAESKEGLEERSAHWEARVAHQRERTQHARAVLSQTMEALPARLNRMENQSETLLSSLTTLHQSGGIEQSTLTTSSAGLQVDVNAHTRVMTPCLFVLEPTRLRGCHWEFEIAAGSVNEGILIAGTAWD